MAMSPVTASAANVYRQLPSLEFGVLVIWRHRLMPFKMRLKIANNIIKMNRASNQGPPKVRKNGARAMIKMSAMKIATIKPTRSLNSLMLLHSLASLTCRNYFKQLMTGW